MTSQRQNLHHHTIDRDTLWIINRGLTGMKRGPEVPEISMIKSTIRLRQADVKLIEHKIAGMDDETKTRAEQTIKQIKNQILKLHMRVLRHG